MSQYFYNFRSGRPKWQGILYRGDTIKCFWASGMSFGLLWGNVTRCSLSVLFFISAWGFTFNMQLNTLLSTAGGICFYKLGKDVQ